MGFPLGINYSLKKTKKILQSVNLFHFYGSKWIESEWNERTNRNKKRIPYIQTHWGLAAGSLQWIESEWNERTNRNDERIPYIQTH